MARNTAAAVIAKPEPNGANGESTSAVAMSPAAVLLLDDEVNQRIVLTWHLVPAPILAADSLFDKASYSCRVAGVSLDVAVSRLHALMGMGVLRGDGTVDENAHAYLTRKGRAKLHSTHGPIDQPSTMAEKFIAQLSADELAAFLNRAAPDAVKQLSWEED